jgi:hypothetical protein
MCVHIYNVDLKINACGGALIIIRNKSFVIFWCVLETNVECFTLSHTLVTIDGVLDWMTGFIDTLYTQLGATGNYSALIFLHTFSSPLHMHCGSQSSPVVSWQWIYHSPIGTSDHTWSLILTAELPSCHYSAATNSEDSTQFNYKLISSRAGLRNSTTVLYSVVEVTLRLTVSQSVSLGVEPQLRSCFCGAPSLTRGRVCLLYMLLALASVVFLGSESRGTRDHILLPQIWDFPFRRLLRLAGSRWRHSTTTPSHLLCHF